MGVGLAGFSVPLIRECVVGIALTTLPKHKYLPALLIFLTFPLSLFPSIPLISLASSWIPFYP